MEFDELSNRVIGCALEVHKALGPGLLESVYEECLSIELSKAGIDHELQKELPICYKGKFTKGKYRADLLISNLLIVELKTIEKIQPIHEAQILTYMKLAEIKIGLLINFNVSRLKYGIKRFVLSKPTD